MANDRQQVRTERTRRSRRNRNGEQETAQVTGQAFEQSQAQFEEIDTIINDIVTPSDAEDSVVMGADEAHGVRTISSEDLVRNFRQQGGE
ncbi:MAG: hypothetical protein K8S97_11250 [Anaerolineae bacterium]|nr:hypothetical protein [Anaerolineae bacterium]